MPTNADSLSQFLIEISRGENATGYFFARMQEMKARDESKR